MDRTQTKANENKASSSSGSGSVLCCCGGTSATETPPVGPTGDKITRRTMKLLLYGPGESGKTTILRQMMLLRGDNLIEQRKQSKGLICSNVIEGAFFTIVAARKFNIPLDDPECVEAVTLVENAYNEFSPSPSHATLNNKGLVDAILRLVKDSNFQQVLDRRSEYPLYENWLYFANELRKYPEWGGNEWVPSVEDLLHSRITTTGQNDFKFEVSRAQYQLIDIGGQRTERRKFLHLFNQIDCLVFVGSLSEYDQCLLEDDTENRLTETVKLWKNSIIHQDFAKTWFLVFLNKFDSFQEKYYRRKIPIQLKFKYKHPPPTYDQEINEDCELAINWFKKLYSDQIPTNRKDQVRIYVTSSLDPRNNNIDRVMTLCTDFLTHSALQGNSV